jgi:hypothetical protein
MTSPATGAERSHMRHGNGFRAIVPDEKPRGVVVETGAYLRDPR